MLVDSHCHLTDSPLREQLAAVLGRAESSGVTKIIVPGYDLLASRAACRLAAARPGIYAAIGLHPAWIDENGEFDPEPFRQLARLRSPLAIGEIGLDFALPDFSEPIQTEVLRRQLELARLLSLPVIIHCRRAFEPLYLILRAYPEVNGVIHAFGGSRQLAHRFIDLGYYLGIGGALTRLQARKLRELVMRVPKERLLLETDAPYLGSVTVPKGRSEPADVLASAQSLAEILNLAVSEVAELTTRNAVSLFGDAILSGEGFFLNSVPGPQSLSRRCELVEDCNENRAFARLELLFGKEGLARLRKAHVIVVGLGAVGSFAAEALARTAVGRLTLVDFDLVGETNLNRQLFALRSNLGRPKTDAARERLLDINPRLNLVCRQVFYHHDTAEELLEGERFNFLIDAIDGAAPKLDLIRNCLQRDIPFIASMGAAGRNRPASAQIADLMETEGCPLARVVRKKLRREGVGKGRVPVVYAPAATEVESRDPADFAESEREEFFHRGRRRRIQPSAVFMPGVFGLLAAQYAVERIIS